MFSMPGRKRGADSRKVSAALSLTPTRTRTAFSNTAQANSDLRFDELPWQRWWVLQQVRAQPQRLLRSLPGLDLDDDAGLTTFFAVWNQIREFVLAPGPKSINSIADALLSLGMCSIDNDYDPAQATKDLVFAVLGWQTMLYKPDYSPASLGGYNILNETDAHRGGARLSLNQMKSASNNNLADFLLGFGMMLPPANYCIFDDVDDQALFGRLRTVSCKDLNAHVLAKVCGITIQWVDSPSCHLELDRQSGRLFLYRYPSFCVSSLRQHQGRGGNDSRRSVLHHCALDTPGPTPWATEEDVTGLLEEILLSYRLIFGQTKRSRIAFRRLQPFARMDPQGHDKLLAQLCGRKRLDWPVAGLVERDEYDLAGDFPHLRSRLVRLSDYAASRKPRSIRQLWGDKRDSTAWLALWSVLVFGSVSVLLALLQTVFQVLQYVDARRGGAKL